MHGKFFWYDIMTTDTRAAAKFYGDVVGWTAQDTNMPGQDYTVLHAGGRGVAGMMPIPEDILQAVGMPFWMGYIQVDDVDDCAARIEREGGAIRRAPTTIPGVIRFAVMGDPQGAGFIIAKPLNPDAPPELPPGTPGTIGWRELMAGDWQAAFAFYEKLFGWAKGDAFDMGPMGTYQLFTQDGAAVGGMMNKPATAPHPYWGYYFNVEAIDAAAARITAAGGKILMGPQQVPGGQWIVTGLDAQGGHFSLLSTQK